MTPDEIELMLRNLADSKRYLEETSRLLRAAADDRLHKVPEDRESVRDQLARLERLLLQLADEVKRLNRNGEQS